MPKPQHADARLLQLAEQRELDYHALIHLAPLCSSAALRKAVLTTVSNDDFSGAFGLLHHINPNEQKGVLRDAARLGKYNVVCAVSNFWKCFPCDAPDDRLLLSTEVVDRRLLSREVVDRRLEVVDRSQQRKAKEEREEAHRRLLILARTHELTIRELRTLGPQCDPDKLYLALTLCMHADDYNGVFGLLHHVTDVEEQKQLVRDAALSECFSSIAAIVDFWQCFGMGE
jgi:hypothetical protein